MSATKMSELHATTKAWITRSRIVLSYIVVKRSSDRTALAAIDGPGATRRRCSRLLEALYVKLRRRLDACDPGRGTLLSSSFYLAERDAQPMKFDIIPNMVLGRDTLLPSGTVTGFRIRQARCGGNHPVGARTAGARR